jgi:hypothetical protein
MRKVRETLMWGGRKSIILLEGCQASPARPSESRVKVKTIEWLQAVT